jgi:multisubunit Na+/H+ antiporter MnhB subunit
MTSPASTATAESILAALQKKENDRKAIRGCAGILLGLFVSPFIFAFGIATLWRWFVVPLGAVEIGMAHAYGLHLLWIMFRPGTKPSVADKDMVDEFVFGVALTGFLLLAGLIARQFMAV